MSFIAIHSLPDLLFDVITLLIWLIIIEVVVSNLMCVTRKISPFHPFVRGLRSVVNPILSPIRRIMPDPRRTARFDFSPFVAIVILDVIREIL